ncbi:MAG: AsmA-like C-terminal domain-containing protein [Deltaproteobacteria bacterium]|nr:AsmA-like C-terminal domain-containing protein [Deltaproteobacteria bacterium]
MKDGELVTASYQAQGGSFRDLWKIGNMRIEGVIEKGRAALPKSGLEVTHIGGRVGISDGVFCAENFTARVGKSRVTGGRLEVNLSEPGIPYIIDISVDADLGELRPELMRQLDDGTLKNELSRITKLEGKTKVKIGVRKAGGPVEMKLEASGFRLVGNHGEVPYPIEIDGARFLLNGSRAEVGNVNVKVGRSTVSRLSGRLETKKDLQAKLTSGRSRINLEEIFSWLSKYDGVKEALQPIASLKGHVILSSFDLEGPIKEPGRWHFKTKGKAEETEVGVKGEPERFSLPTARFDATGEAGKGRISVRGAKAAFLDASVAASGHLDYGTGGVGQINFRFDGRGEAKSIRRIFDFIKIPPAMDVRPPVSVSDGRIQWRKGNQTSVAGNFTIADGPVVAVDLHHTPERLNIRKLHVRDEASDAVMRLDLKGREAVFEFKGHFEKSTADLILADSEVPHGWIKGDFSARLFLDRPLESRVTGVLEGKDVLVPLNVGVPLVVNRMAIEADEDRVRIKTGRVTWGDMKMGLDGDLHFSEMGFVIHANVTSDELDLTRMEQMLGGESPEPGGPEGDKGGVWDLPLHGVIRLKAGILKHESMTLEPFHADIVFAEELLHVTTRDVRMCGISFPGEFEITREGVLVDIRPEAKDQDLESTVQCLSRERSKVTGRFDLTGHVTGKAKPDRLAESLRGNFHMVAREGRYEKNMIMNRILTFLSISELFRGNVPTLEEQGFEYHSASADVTLVEGGKLQGTAVMDGVTMNMGAEGEVDLLKDQLDLTVLVAPMKTTDWFIQQLPLIGHLLGGSLVSIPIRITGPREDPTMMAVPPSSVGAGLVGIMTRTFELPVKIIEPVIQNEKQGSGSSGPGSFPQ